MKTKRESPTEIATKVQKRIPLREFVTEYRYKRRLPDDASATFDVASRCFQRAGRLSLTDLHGIAKWKSPRSAKRVLSNDARAVQTFTRLAFELANDPKVPASVPIAVLTILKGVRVPMASAVLTAWNPRDFGIIDVNAWAAIFGSSRPRPGGFQPRDYDEYMAILKALRGRTHLTARQIDMALWAWWDLKKRARK